MQWFETTKHLNGFVPLVQFYHFLMFHPFSKYLFSGFHVGNKGSNQDSLFPPSFESSLLSSDKGIFLIFNNVLHNAGSVIITVLASCERKTFVCIICFHIITNKSYMSVITVLSFTSLFFFLPFTDFWMSAPA